jgi:hypothetical protein
MVRSSQTMHQSRTDTNILSKRDIPHDPCHLGVPSGVSKTIFEPMVHYAQTVHLCSVKISTISKWTDTNTVSKWTKIRFYMIHVIQQFHRVRPKLFLSLWYVRRKSCTYLSLTLTLSPNRLKWDSRWSTSPRSFIGGLQNNFWAYGMFDANRAPILRQD